MLNKNSNSSYAFTNLFKNDLENPNKLVSKYMKYVSQLPKNNEQINYDIRDLIIRLLPLDTEINGLEKRKSIDGSTEIFYNRTKIKVDYDPISNINTLLFITNSVDAFMNSRQRQLAIDLARCISNGTVEFKLNCD